MKTFLLNHEKWYNSDYSIFQNNEKVGYLLTESFKKMNTLGLYGIEFTVRRGNVWRNERFIYQGNVLFAEIIEKTFKGETILILQNGDQYIIRQNVWKGIYTLYRGERALGEFKGKSFNNIATVADELSLPLIASFILTSTIQKYAYVAFIAFIPVFITVFS